MEISYWVIGDNIRRMRMEKGMTQEELAEKALLSPKGIQKVEAGRSGMYMETFIRIAKALNVSLNILAGMDEMEEWEKIKWEAFYIISRESFKFCVNVKN
ncbi:XRE family transcriptional regulator [Parablautia intestinalis]|uniref:XRE family transcriptional regulator n=1 Tax=Parablautia intestinalis TaxID=2320100 RepID=A0A3A9A5D9_9FIRM|nr:helix-turn-helix transcriptional regulator [Parablautia intestinalis]RKI86940.1 XRE family transcriptional regulator [Parablautia intestinalis]